MTSASRSGPRSPRRSRRRQAILVCCGLSYLSEVVAGVLAILSLLLDVGGGARYALLAAAAFALLALLLLARERLDGRRRREEPFPAHLA